MSKWGKKYWEDLGERVAASAIGGLLAALTADASGVTDGGLTAWWVLVGVPALTSLLKGLLVNLGSDEDTASLVDVTSTGKEY